MGLGGATVADFATLNAGSGLAIGASGVG
jgi:hypothetical protein